MAKERKIKSEDIKKWVADRLKEGWSPEHIIEVAARFDHHTGDVVKALDEVTKRKDKK